VNFEVNNYLCISLEFKFVSGSDYSFNIVHVYFEFVLCFCCDFFHGFIEMTFEMCLHFDHIIFLCCSLSTDILFAYGWWVILVNCLNFNLNIFLYKLMTFFNLLIYYIILFIRSSAMMFLFMYLYCFYTWKSIVYYHVSGCGCGVASVNGGCRYFSFSHLTFHISVWEKLKRVLDVGVELFWENLICYDEVNDLHKALTI
jgi:hypothetical protein